MILVETTGQRGDGASISMPGEAVDTDTQALLDMIQRMNDMSKGSYVDHDATSDLIFTGMSGRSPSDGEGIGDLNSAMRSLSPMDLYKASTYRMGAFMCHVVPFLAFRNGWKFVEQKDTREPVDDDLNSELLLDTRKWKMRVQVPVAVDGSATLGRSLVFIDKMSGTGRRTRQILRVVPIDEEYIDWHGPEPSVYRPLVWYGRTQIEKALGPEEVVIFRHTPDMFGNILEGRPAHFNSYKTIIRAERITRAYCNLIENRGMGLALVGLTGGTLNTADIIKYTQQFGNPGSRAFLFYPKSLMEITVQDGIKPGFQYPDVDDRLTRHGSMSSGWPGQRMEGTQTGMVTGGKTDQDNTAENYAWWHELYEDSIIDLYYLINPEYIDKQFELDFPYDIIMDPAEKASIFEQYMRSITSATELMTVGPTYKLLDMKVPEGMDENENLAVALNKIQQELQPTPMDQANIDLVKAKADQAGNDGKPPGGKEAGKADRDSMVDDDAMRAWKETYAGGLFEKGFTVSQVELALRVAAGSSLGHNRLAEIRASNRR